MSTAWVAAVSVTLAAVLLSAVGVAALRTDAAAADTVLAAGADAVLVLPDGATRPAVEGETVPRGATVRAGRTGAVLATREREVHLGAETAVTVLDGVRQVLDAGFVLVDAAGAPGLDVRTRAGTVTAPDGALVRVDSGPLTRVGVLRGAAAQVRPAGRSATTDVPAFFQVQVPAGGLPGPGTPYALTPGDRYEEQLAADLVRDDADLTALGARLDAGGAAGSVVLAALRTDVPAGPALPAGAPGSEGALGYLLAAAAPQPVELPRRYAEVRALRTAGGSWGIVAAIVRAPVGAVAGALDGLLAPEGTPVRAAGPLSPADLLALVGGAPAPAPAPGPDAPVDDDAPAGPQTPVRPQPTSAPPPASPRPVPVPSPLAPVGTVVDAVVGTVLDLVGGTPAPVPPAPSPSPQPLLQVELTVPPLLG